ncbi:hypothetical protein [Alicyclobacillus sp.]|uniref:hypothetical protein n=1 Tax=Alicyclobacillus sp. TaxID=61169 RepID=UPI0025B9FF9D|nr:hypothetical protein [Alicyclobacillus sp.]MCL6518104.1 hypothetical protein [Alicyclobacillus sp.]
MYGGKSPLVPLTGFGPASGAAWLAGYTAIAVAACLTGLALCAIIVWRTRIRR